MSNLTNGSITCQLPTLFSFISQIVVSYWYLTTLARSNLHFSVLGQERHQLVSVSREMQIVQLLAKKNMPVMPCCQNNRFDANPGPTLSNVDRIVSWRRSVEISCPIEVHCQARESSTTNLSMNAFYIDITDGLEPEGTYWPSRL